ncbi:alpha/beta hydrolase [Amycolatopsis sp. NPDC058986]|uniref:alpha/beta hydrolase n=1 Tax=unclassified Amycolatopsis TaxID=2618356 RepID=UPI00366AD43F
MADSPEKEPPPTPIPPRITEHARTSWQSYALAGLLRTTGRPLGNVWPHTPQALGAIDPALVTLLRPALRAHGPDTDRSWEAVDAAGVPARIARASTVVAPKRTILHMHGGGFVFGSAAVYREFAYRLSRAADAEVILFDYRHPPQHNADAMTGDCLAVYQWARHRNPALPLVVSGDSAGSNLAVGTLVAARDAGLAMPTALISLSGWYDLDYRHPRRAPRDAFFSLPFAARSARMLGAGTNLPPSLRPLEADLTGLPPTLLQLGAREPLREGNRRLATTLGAAGVPVQLQLWQHQVHVFQLFSALLPEGRHALDEITTFLDNLATATTAPKHTNLR